MDREKRKGEKPIPDDVDKKLNETQRRALHQIENFGWSLHFVRRPLFQQPVVVVVSQDGSSIGVLEEDGRLNLAADIKLRD
jgi:hypothetical protein